MENTFRAPKARSEMNRREFLSAGALAAGLLVCGKALAGDPVRSSMAELREKFAEMERYGIPQAVCWSDPTMRRLLFAISESNNSSVLSGNTERIAVFGSDAQTQFRSLNSLLGKTPDSHFGPDSLAALGRKI